MIVHKDFFKDKANDYEKNANRTNNVKNIAEVIKKEVGLDPEMKVMDFGSGTGLLLECIAPFVHKITAVDTSVSMNKKLYDKKESIPCELEILEKDLTKIKLNRKFDVIFSSMTLHHIENIEKLLKDFYMMLNNGGAIALADLDSEDGTFHTEDTGVYHFGFKRDMMVELAKKVGFKNIKIQTASTAQKPQGDYPIFLITATR